MREKLILYGLPFIGVMLIYIVNSYQSIKGPHGGEFRSAKGYYIEVKTTYPFIYSYLLNNKYKPISNKGISCEISFLQEDNSTVDVQLKPFRDDGFLMKSTMQNYSSFRVTYIVLGKSVSANFENESFMVHKQSTANH